MNVGNNKTTKAKENFTEKRFGSIHSDSSEPKKVLGESSVHLMQKSKSSQDY